MMSTCSVALLQVTVAGLDWAANLTSNPAIDTSKASSPDGTQIFFRSDRGGEWSDYKPYVMNADGSGPTNLTSALMVSDISPDWSPDGTEIYFRSDRDGERFDHRPYVMNADGSDVTPVEQVWFPE